MNRAGMAFVHVWFSTKGRRRILEGDLLECVHRELRSAASRHAIKVMECQGVVDHVHILLEVERVEDLPRSMNLLKGASARAIFLEMPDLKHDMHSISFWQAGYASKVVPPAALPSVRRYVRSQWERLEKYEH